MSEGEDGKCHVVGKGAYNPGLFCGQISTSGSKTSYEVGGIVESYEVIDDEKGRILNIGDIIKIGRMKYLVKAISDGSMVKESKGLNHSNKSSAEFKKCKGTCKFCLSEDTQDDPLISPCKCKGSCAEVHISCLKQWLSNKVTRKSTSTA